MYVSILPATLPWEIYRCNLGLIGSVQIMADRATYFLGAEFYLRPEMAAVFADFSCGTVDSTEPKRQTASCLECCSQPELLYWVFSVALKSLVLILQCSRDPSLVTPSHHSVNSLEMTDVSVLNVVSTFHAH